MVGREPLHHICISVYGFDTIGRILGEVCGWMVLLSRGIVYSCRDLQDLVFPSSGCLCLDVDFQHPTFCMTNLGGNYSNSQMPLQQTLEF